MSNQTNPDQTEELAPPTIIRTGRFLDQDAAGYFIPLQKNSALDPEWETIVGLARERYIKAYRERLHSLYVRGSVALGCPIRGSSDLDMIGLLHHNSFCNQYYVWNHVEWEAAFSSELKTMLSFEVQPDLIVASLNRGFLERNNSLPAILATQSVCIYGSDIRQHLPLFAPDETMMYYNGRIKLFVFAAYQNLKRDASPQAVMQVCRTICKAMIRCSFELVLQKEGRFTRDLYLCCMAFATHYPDQAESAWQALHLYISPCQEIAPLLSLIDDFGHWLISQERTIELRHRPNLGQRLLHEMGVRTTGCMRKGIT